MQEKPAVIIFFSVMIWSFPDEVPLCPLNNSDHFWEYSPLRVSDSNLIYVDFKV